ncbi:MAG: hypothetical protein AAFO69_04545 [Bacteroidota bacterium]
MKFNRSIAGIIGFTLIMLLLPQISFAQGAPPRTPIDGGLSLLLAGGAAYGIHKIREARKNANKEQ